MNALNLWPTVPVKGHHPGYLPGYKTSRVLTFDGDVAIDAIMMSCCGMREETSWNILHPDLGILA